MRIRSPSERPRALLVLLVATLVGACSSGPRRYNVLLVTLDTTRKSRMSCYGNPVQTTPNFDALARDGVRFDMAVSQAAVTPVSHASILTGLNPYSHGLRVLHAASGYRLPDSVPTLATVLGDAGWSTGAFLSSFTVSGHFGLPHGFDTLDSGLEGDPDKMVKNEEGLWRWEAGANQRRSDATTDRFIEWLRQTSPPLFGWVHYWDPHDALRLPPDDVVRRFVSPEATPQERMLQRYDAELFFMDSQFGRIVDALRELGLYDDTIIVVIADHGEGLLDGMRNHGWYRHRMLYQEQINVPFILRLPGGPAGRVVDALVRSIDILPTVLDLLEIDPPGPVEGASLLPLLEGRAQPPRTAYADALNLFDLNAHLVKRRPDAALLYTLMDERWKLIYRPLRPEESELYDYRRDPQELDNLYASHPDQAHRLLSLLQAADCFVDEPFPAEGADDALQQDELERLRSLGYLAD